MEGDPLQGEEGFEAFGLRWLSSFKSGESCTLLTMQVIFRSSSITGPLCPSLQCDNEGQRGREERRVVTMGNRTEDNRVTSHVM